jgi:hypothetical protein
MCHVPSETVYRAPRSCRGGVAPWGRRSQCREDDVKSYLPQTWFDARLAVGPSRVHGHGIYATSPIAQAESLWATR